MASPSRRDMAVFAMNLLTGPVGVVLAAPLAGAILVLVRDVYVEGILGDTARILLTWPLSK